MPTDLPPAKRARANLEGEENGTREVKLCKSLWFYDGNIVLQAEDTQFRLHRSVLARHSRVFEDMFSFPQPQSGVEGMEMVDGCPLVHLSDTASDVEDVVKILYDGATKMDPASKQLSYFQVAAMARIGRKYEIPFLWTTALAYLTNDYPSTLAGWDNLQKDGSRLIHNTTFSEPEIASRCLNLAFELSLERILPTAFLRYMNAVLDSDDLGFDTFLLNETNPPLLPELHLTAIRGRERFVHMVWTEESCGLWSMETEAHQFKGQSDTCRLARLDKFRQFALAPIHSGASVPLKSWQDRKFEVSPFVTEQSEPHCGSCEEALEQVYQEIRLRIWSYLPIAFMCLEWDKLKNDDH